MILPHFKGTFIYIIFKKKQNKIGPTSKTKIFLFSDKTDVFLKFSYHLYKLKLEFYLIRKHTNQLIEF